MTSPSPLPRDAGPHAVDGRPWALLAALASGIAVQVWWGAGWWLAGPLLLLAAGAALAAWRRPAWRGGWRLALGAAAALLALGVVLAWSAARPQAQVEEWSAAHAGPVRLRGRLDGPPRLQRSGGAAMAAFEPARSALDFRLAGVRVAGADGWFALGAGVQVRLDEPPPGGAWERLGEGDTIEVLGRLQPLRPPLNPGAPDMAAFMREQGVGARLFVDGEGALRRLHAAPWWTPPAWRRRLGGRALDALHAGLGADPQRTALLEAILLGRRNPEMEELREDFRATGLMHLLVLSGANVGIFLGAVWFLGRCVCGRPRWVALAMGLILALFLLMVPAETPVLRAGLMALLFTLGAWLGRPLPGSTILVLAAVALLLWQPLQLFSAGFQLSFAAVAVLVLLVRPLTQRLWRRLTGEGWLDERAAAARPWRRRCLYALLEALVGCVAVSLALTPVMMAWFPGICPLGAFTTLLAAPVAALLLWLGYLKVALGLVWAPLSAPLAWPLERLADLLAWEVRQLARAPGMQLGLLGPATAPLAGISLALLFAGLGWWAAGGRRLRASALGGALCVALGLGLVWGEQGWRRLGSGRDDGLVIHALAVGDGSCYLLRRGDTAWLYDCGSRDTPQVGRRVVLPALRSLGVTRLRGIILSHADLDHFGGVPDLLDGMAVDEVVGGPSLAREAAANPAGPEALLFAALRDHGVRYTGASAGWQAEWGGVKMRAVWPPAEDAARSTNDDSLALVAEFAGRRAGFFGDLEAAGLSGLLASGVPLRADVAELPHHGGFVDGSGAWLEAVGPRVVFQSSGRRRLEAGPGLKWAAALRGVERLATAESGMVWVRIGPDGTLAGGRFLDAGEGR